MLTDRADSTLATDSHTPVNAYLIQVLGTDEDVGLDQGGLDLDCEEPL